MSAVPKLDFTTAPRPESSSPVSGTSAAESAVSESAVSAASVMAPPTTLLTIISTEIPMGSIITAVAVFETHMETNPVAIMKPAIIGPGLLPMMDRVMRAIRRCRFQRCMAKAMRKPPRNRKMIGFP